MDTPKPVIFRRLEYASSRSRPSFCQIFPVKLMAPSTIAQTPVPPYFAVIFTSQRTEGERGYDSVAARMVELAAQQPGFLGVETVRGADGFGITVSYWRSLADITAWRLHSEHQVAQATGKRVWYADYQLRICEVQRTYSK
jgi:heme-degrading monooxygenase HmoA